MAEVSQFQGGSPEADLVGALAAPWGKSDPLLMQHLNTKVFEAVIKELFPVCTDKTFINTNDNLTDDEENALRYAAGYVIRSAQSKIMKLQYPYKAAMLSILKKLTKVIPARHT